MIDLRLSRENMMAASYAALTCVSVSLGVAVFLSARAGLGLSELAIAFWSVPLAVVIGALQPVTGSRLRRASRLRIWLTLTVGGSLVAIVWTLAVAYVMGPWFQTAGVPVLFCWLAGALTGLVVGHTAKHQLTVGEGTVACALAVLASVAVAVKSEDLVAFATGDQTLDVVVLKASGVGSFQVDSSMRSILGDDGVAQIQAAG